MHLYFPFLYLVHIQKSTMEVLVVIDIVELFSFIIFEQKDSSRRKNI